MNIDREILINDTIQRAIAEVNKALGGTMLSHAEERYTRMKVLLAMLHAEVTERQFDILREALPERGAEVRRNTQPSKPAATKTNPK